MERGDGIVLAAGTCTCTWHVREQCRSLRFRNSVQSTPAHTTETALGPKSHFQDGAAALLTENKGRLAQRQSHTALQPKSYSARTALWPHSHSARTALSPHSHSARTALWRRREDGVVAWRRGRVLSAGSNVASKSGASIRLRGTDRICVRGNPSITPPARGARGPEVRGDQGRGARGPEVRGDQGRGAREPEVRGDQGRGARGPEVHGDQRCVGTRGARGPEVCGDQRCAGTRGARGPGEVRGDQVRGVRGPGERCAGTRREVRGPEERCAGTRGVRGPGKVCGGKVRNDQWRGARGPGERCRGLEERCAGTRGARGPEVRGDQRCAGRGVWGPGERCAGTPTQNTCVPNDVPRLSEVSPVGLSPGQFPHLPVVTCVCFAQVQHRTLIIWFCHGHGSTIHSSGFSPEHA